MRDCIQDAINALREDGKEQEARSIEELRALNAMLVNEVGTLGDELSRFRQIAGKMYCKYD